MHNHHCDCKHTDLTFCKKCDLVYCKGCNREWQNPCTQQHYPYFYTTTTPAWGTTTDAADFINDMARVAHPCDHSDDVQITALSGRS